MDKIELSIKPSLFSGYNGPKFYKKPEISTYDKLPVDYNSKIPSPSIAEARKRIQQNIIKETNNNEVLP